MDDHTLWPPEDKGETQSLLRRRAKRLLKKTGMPATELDEVEQDLAVALWLQSRSFDPAKGKWQDFAKARTAQSSAKYVRKRCARKRDPRRCQSLNVPVICDGSVVELGDTIASDEARRHRQFESEPEGPRDEPVCLPQVDAVLPPGWRDVIKNLDRPSISALAHATKVKRSTLSSRIQKLRQNFPDDFRM